MRHESCAVHGLLEAEPPSDAERDRAFRAERLQRLRAGIRIIADTKAEVVRILKEAQDLIAGQLAAAPTDWQIYHLGKLKEEVARALASVEAGAGRAVSDGLDAAWAAGVQLVDAPLAAGGVELAAMLPAIDTRRLEAMRMFCTDRIANVSADLVNKINGELGLAMVGGRTPFEAAQAVAQRLDGGIKRAVTIVQTEVGAAFSAATQARQEQASQVLRGMRKQWRRSGKVHSRLTHDLADGQIREVDEPFLVGGRKIMYPRDPAADAKDRIFCGCTSLPHMAHWEMSHPLDKPFTKDELDASPVKRRLDEVKAVGFDTWAKRILSRETKTDGTVMTAGTLLPDVEEFLRIKKGVAPYTREIGVADRMLAHYVRDTKKKAGKAVPERIARRLPEILANPQAVLWDLKARQPTLHYVVPVGPTDPRFARFTLRIAETDDRQKLKRHNFVISAGLVARSELVNAGAYERVRGTL